ncbi:MAG TPA: hypothetical protein VIN75_03070 [Burkholderiaceae bacterium]
MSPRIATATGNDVTRSPRWASVGSLGDVEATDAAHEAPAMREVRKLDSLSAATKGPTARILRFVLQCVNWGAGWSEGSRIQFRDAHMIAARSWHSHAILSPRIGPEIEHLARGSPAKAATESFEGCRVDVVAVAAARTIRSECRFEHVGFEQAKKVRAVVRRSDARGVVGACGGRGVDDREAE